MCIVGALLFSKFECLVEQDPYFLGGGQSAGQHLLTIKDGQCVFSLKALFTWIKPDLTMDYLAFKSAIYKSTLNQQLLTLGYKIEVHMFIGNVDRSIYRLVRL